jgi:hypothetical protein
MIQVADRIVDLLNTDTELDHFRRNARCALLCARQLPIRCRCRMARLVVGFSEIDETCHEFERVIEPGRRGKTFLDSKSHQGTGFSAKRFFARMRCTCSRRILDEYNATGVA